MYALRVAVLAAVGVVALTATGVRIGDHPAYVRVVVDFNGKVPASQVEFDRLTGTTATVHVAHPGIKTHTGGRAGEGVRVALQPGTQALHIAMSFASRRFKYLSYAVVTGNHLAVDLWKSAPPSKAAEVKSGGCLSLQSWHVTKGSVLVHGTEHGVFENTFRVVVRGANGTVRGRRTVVHGGSWSTRVRYTASHRRAGTLEAVAFSQKDGSLACLAQMRVTLPAS
ncbi:MAG TPA: Gmad2 immunoglobulin-like domain-containing protein [Gaiellaceae bacterium]|nr:Gmad2 immunoglobulin-like domain-containing protein [Gaiellaceae bacterium]